MYVHVHLRAYRAGNLTCSQVAAYDASFSTRCISHLLRRAFVVVVIVPPCPLGFLLHLSVVLKSIGDGEGGAQDLLNPIGVQGPPLTKN